MRLTIAARILKAEIRLSVKAGGWDNRRRQPDRRSDHGPDHGLDD